MKLIFFFLILLLNPLLVIADNSPQPEFIAFDRNEFHPVSGGRIEIPFSLPFKADVILAIYSPDDELVRELKASKVLEKGKQKIMWDGKDEHGTVVPDEAWNPVLIVTDESGKKFTVDHRQTGGEVLEDLGVELTSDKHIIFQLTQPARVLSRTGIKGGPMLKTLSDWKPRNRGKVVLRWNGYDSENLRDLRTDPNISFLVTAYRLPEYSILTSGNKSLNYRDYRDKLGKDIISSETEKKQLERNGQRINPHYYLPKDIIMSPSVSLGFKESYPEDEKYFPVVDCPCVVRVDLASEDKEQLKESLYEISFFIDDEFVSEQEQGYVPFTWRWTPANLKPGEHIMTVNVSGLRGEVGVRSMKFILPE